MDDHIQNKADLTHYLGLPVGCGVEIISPQALSKAFYNAKTDYQREHVTPYIYQNKDQFKILEPISTGDYYHPNLRLTIDTPEDFHLAQTIFEKLYQNKNTMPIPQIVRFLNSSQS